MTTAKVAVTVPEELLRRARVAVRKGAARSLSAYVSLAIAQKTMVDDLEDLLVQMLAETGGPLTTDEIRHADEALDGVRRERRRR